MLWEGRRRWEIMTYRPVRAGRGAGPGAPEGNRNAAKGDETIRDNVTDCSPVVTENSIRWPGEQV